MPWQASDAKRFKKGLSLEESKAWARLANRVLADCMKKGGTDEKCAPSAIRIANSRIG